MLLLPKRLTFRHWKGDLVGGLTAGVVALPLALAFGVASGAGALAGLYGAIVVGFFAALWGGTPSQVSGPTGPMTVVMAQIFATHKTLAFDAVFFGGLLQIALGFSGVGKFIRFIPRPVVSGFMSGIGVIIILIQIPPLVGDRSPGGPMEALEGLGSLQINPHAAILGVASVAMVYLLPKLWKALPAALGALFLCTLAAHLLAWEVPRLGEIPRSLPELNLSFFSLHSLHFVMVPAITLALLGTLDSLLTSVVADTLTDTKHDSDRELVGQGVGNALSGLIGGLPGAGATMRTFVNIRAGGRTPLSGIVHALFLLAILLGLAPLAARIPMSVLAGILLTVGIGIIDFRGLRELPRAPRSDRAVLLLVLVLTVFVDLILAVAIGFLVACLLFIQELNRMELVRGAALEETEVTLPQSLVGRVHVFQAEGPFFFGTTHLFLRALHEQPGELSTLLIGMERVPLIDQTGAHALQQFAKRMEEQNMRVHLVGLRPEPMLVLRRLGVIPRCIPEQRVHADFHDAIGSLSVQREVSTGDVLKD